MRIPYEPPTIIPLGGGVAYAQGKGGLRCRNGGTPAPGQQCKNGGVATGKECDAGGIASGKCENGASTGRDCKPGGVAAKRCKTGGAPR